MLLHTARSKGPVKIVSNRHRNVFFGHELLSQTADSPFASEQLLHQAASLAC